MPQWDVERFLDGDEAETALITLERNRLTFAWKCADIDADGMALRLAPASPATPATPTPFVKRSTAPGAKEPQKTSQCPRPEGYERSARGSRARAELTGS